MSFPPRERSRIANVSPSSVTIRSSPRLLTDARASAPSTASRSGDARHVAVGSAVGVGAPARSTNRSAASASASRLGGRGARRRAGEKRGRRLAVDEFAPAQRIDEKVPVGRDAGDEGVAKRPHQPAARLLAVRAEGDHLGEKGIVMRPDRRSAFESAIDPHALPFARPPGDDAPGRGKEVG